MGGSAQYAAKPSSIIDFNLKNRSICQYFANPFCHAMVVPPFDGVMSVFVKLAKKKGDTKGNQLLNKFNLQ